MFFLLLHTLDISFTNITTADLKPANITNDCYVSNDLNAITNTSVSITKSSVIDSATPSTYSTIDDTISSKTYIIITSTNISTNNSDFSRNKEVVIPVLLYCLTSGLLALCFIICIVGLICKRKHTSGSKAKVPEFLLTLCNPLFSRSLVHHCNIVMSVYRLIDILIRVDNTSTKCK